MNSTEKQFNKLLEESKSNDDILGFLLGGSRGKGFENEYSDYDVTIIVKDNVIQGYQERFSNMNLINIDLVIISISEFRIYALWNSNEAWDRYDFTHIKVLVSKTDEIQSLIDEKGSIPKDKYNEFISSTLDAYINSVYRSVKCFRNNNIIGFHLEACVSIPYLLDLVFGLHNRPKPFYGYVEKELEKYPLEKLPWNYKIFLEKINNILTNGDLKTQQGILKVVEELFRKEGFGNIFDDWKGKDKWAMEYSK